MRRVVIRIPSRVTGPGADISAPYACVLPCLWAGFDALEELPEQRLGVVRSWRSFGMILNGEHWQGAMPQAFYRFVVQVHVRHLELGGARNSGVVSLDREAMILRRYQHAPRRDIEHWVVSAAMAVRHLGRGAAKCETDQLMAKADAEHRNTRIGELAYRLRCVRNRVGIAGAVG